MSDSPQQTVQNPSTTEPTPAEPVSLPVPSGDPTPTPEHRYSDSDAPYPWAVGKTQAECLDWWNKNKQKWLIPFGEKLRVGVEKL